MITKMVKGQQVGKQTKQAVKKPAAKPTGSPGKGMKLPDCVSCGALIAADSRALQCDGCTGEATWKCADCLGLTPEIYSALVGGGGSELQWLGEGCRMGQARSKKPDAVCERLDTMADLLTKFLDRVVGIEDVLAKKADSGEVDKLETRVLACEEANDKVARKLEALCANLEDATKGRKDEATLEKRVGKLEAIFGDNSMDKLIERSEDRQQQFLADKREQEEIERRKNCAVVHGIPEMQSDKVEERVENDIAQIAAMMAELGMDSAKVTKIIRLGKRLPTTEAIQDGAKPRPIKLVLETEANKWELLQKAKNLKTIQEGAWKKVFIHQDLTINQREQRNKMLKELEDRKEKGEKDFVLFRGRIITRTTTTSASTSASTTSTSASTSASTATTSN